MGGPKSQRSGLLCPLAAAHLRRLLRPLYAHILYPHHVRQDVHDNLIHQTRPVVDPSQEVIGISRTKSMSKRTYKFRVYPTRKQAQALQWTLDRCRELYNAALQERKEAYKYARMSINYEQSGEPVAGHQGDTRRVQRYPFSSATGYLTPCGQSL